MDNIGIYFKAVLTSFFTAISLKLGDLGGLLWLFIAAVILDYVTGVLAAAYNKELHSGTGLRGVIKKVGECFVIAVALLTDEVISGIGGHLGMKFSTGGAIATTVVIWLILNELISILENISKLDVAFPPFLMSAITLLKNQAGKAGDTLVDGSKEQKLKTTDANSEESDDEESPVK